MERFPGYTLVRTEDCPEQHGTLTVLTHDVSGATVLLVENEDSNKAFGIGFGTFPSDDTGVFHILEHSVLAGSEKYPVTSPFLQLLKSSMASFLNAMTFPDKTVYPFATPNETDFKNLMDVYLNAVFCPLALFPAATRPASRRCPMKSISGYITATTAPTTAALPSMAKWIWLKSWNCWTGIIFQKCPRAPAVRS